MSIQSDLHKLKSLRAQAVALVEKIQASSNQALARIHENYGFDALDNFISAVSTSNRS